MSNHFFGLKIFTNLTLVSLLLGVVACVYSYPLASVEIPVVAYSFMLFWLVCASLFVLFSYKNFVAFFLLSLLAMLIGWRIAAIYDIKLISWILFFTFICMVANFLYCAYRNINSGASNAISLAEWHLIFIRLYIGFNFVPHFTEKLFAGPLPHMVDVKAFMHLQVPAADFFVWTAGFCELGAVIALGLGFMMRLGAWGAAAYLLIATYLGHHFGLGFIWAGEGGGWEFATMWMVLIVSFALSGVNTFSIDQELETRYKNKIPKIIKKCM